MAVDKFGEEIDEYEDYRETHSADGKRRKWTAGKIAKRVCGICVFIIIAAIMITFVMRCTQLESYPTQMEAYYWTEQTAELYDSDEMKCYELYMAQNFSSSGYANSVSGDFFVVFARLTETDGNNAQIQFTIRYNNSTLSHRGDDYSSTDNSEEPFVYILSDNLGNSYQPDILIQTKSGNLNYRKLVYENVDMSDVTKLFVNIYNSDTFDFSSIVTEDAEDNGAFSGIRIFTSAQTYAEYKMTKTDLATKFY